MVCAAVRRDFSLSSLVALPLGSAVVSAPPLDVGHSQESAPKAVLEHTSPPQ